MTGMKTQQMVPFISASKDEFVRYGDCCVEHKENRVSSVVDINKNLPTIP